MGQSGYAEGFINAMLGWIRGLAASVAAGFQSTGSGASGGAAFLSWLGAHWLSLLVVLIAIGIAIDWLVWMLRWRPYWLWVGKRRIVLDDELEDDREPPRRFRSAVLHRDEEYAREYDRYDAEDRDYADDYYDGLDGDAFNNAFDLAFDEAAGDDADDWAELEGDAVDDGREDLFPDYDAGEPDAAFEEPPAFADFADFDEEWDDAPRKPRERKSRLLSLSRRKRAEDEDPFAMNDADLGDLDDDFYSVLSGAPGDDPLILTDKDDAPAATLLPLDDDMDGGDYDERIGYRSSYAPKTGTPLSRKARRKSHS